jgi:hypothetical protein
VDGVFEFLRSIVRWHEVFDGLPAQVLTRLGFSPLRQLGAEEVSS